MKKIAAAFAVSTILMLSGCMSSPPASEELPKLTFSQMQQINLNVAKVEVYDEFKSSGQMPNVEFLFPTSPADAAKDMISKKLIAAGDHNVLRAVIENAGVVSEKLPVANDAWSIFKNEPAERLRGEVAIRFEMVGEQAPDIILGHASVIGKRTKTIMENASPADRDRAYVELTEELMGDVYDGFNTVVKNTFGMP